MAEVPNLKPDMTGDEVSRMHGLIEALSAYIEQFHGGHVRMLNFDGKVLTVEMGGACVGCPLSVSTLRGWIEGNVRQFFPEIESVVGVEAKSPG